VAIGGSLSIEDTASSKFCGSTIYTYPPVLSYITSRSFILHSSYSPVKFLIEIKLIVIPCSFANSAILLYVSFASDNVSAFPFSLPFSLNLPIPTFAKPSVQITTVEPSENYVAIDTDTNAEGPSAVKPSGYNSYNF